jgi:hypothetical protein
VFAIFKTQVCLSQLAFREVGVASLRTLHCVVLVLKLLTLELPYCGAKVVCGYLMEKNVPFGGWK